MLWYTYKKPFFRVKMFYTIYKKNSMDKKHFGMIIVYMHFHKFVQKMLEKHAPIHECWNLQGYHDKIETMETFFEKVN